MRFIAGYTQLESLVEEALGEPTDFAAATRLFESVSSNLQAADRSVHSALRSAMIVGALFELLSRASVAEIVLWGLKISDLGNIQRVLPIVVGFFFHQAMMSLSVRRVYIDVQKQTLRFLHPEGRLTHLASLMHPFSIIGAESLLVSLHHGRLGATASRFGFATAVAVMIGFPALIAYELVRNWSQFREFDWLWLVVAITVLIFVLRGFLALAVVSKALEESTVTN